MIEISINPIFIILRKLALNPQLDTLNLTMCTGIDLDCCSVLTGQIKKYLKNPFCFY
jgi:hypothetical protein